MAEQRLDVRVTEQGTAVVTSQLDKLEKKLTGVEEAQKAETAATQAAAAALGGINKNLTTWLEKQNSKLAALEKVSGLLGKFNLALDLVNKAYQFGAKLVDEYIRKTKDLAPALETVNGKLREQLGIYKQISDAQKSTLAAGGTLEESIRAGGLTARGRQLAAENEAILDEALRVGGTDRAKLEGPGFGAGGLAIPALINQLKEGGAVFDEARLQELEQQRKQNANELFRIDLELKRLASDILKREVGSGKPPEPEPARGPRATPRGGNVPGGAGNEARRFTDSGAAEQADTGEDLFSVVQRGIDAASGAMQAGVQYAAAYIGKLNEMAAAMRAVKDQALEFAEATAKSALTASVAAVAEGQNVLRALSMALKGKAIEASVEALWATGKGLYYTATGNPLAGPMFAAAGYFSATAAAAGLGAALAGAGAGGGGGAGGGTSARPDAGARREPSQEASGPTTINVVVDGLAIHTADQISAAMVAGLQRAADTPGMRGRLRRALEADR